MSKPNLTLVEEKLPNSGALPRRASWIRTQTAVHFQSPGKGLLQLANPITSNSLGNLGGLTLMYIEGKGATLTHGELELFIPDGNIVSVQFAQK